jgi:hypothetical protein
MKQILNCFILLVVLTISKAKAQNYTVGLAVNDTLSVSQYFSYNNCFPNYDFTLTFPYSTVTGVEHILIFTSVTPLNSIYTVPGGIIHVGDTLHFTQTQNHYTFYFPTNGTINYIFKAIGTPQIANEIYNCGNKYWLDGLSDCINFRILDQDPVTCNVLDTSVNCVNNTAITPQTNSLTVGSTATFISTTSDPNPSYVWQSNFGQGFQTLNNTGNYSGANSSTLSISNVQLLNHTQPIRVITTSGNCVDTSNVAFINILDTCITNITIYDTLYTTIMDTLVINATLTGINPPNNLNTLKVYPNPANTHITIDYGNFNTMSGYTLKIVNAIGQTVFTTPINQQTSYIDLSTLTGNGIYFLKLIDPQNNTIENRKIVIQ